MMYSLTLLDKQLTKLQSMLTNPQGYERAAYLFCGVSTTTREKRLIVNEIQVVADADIENSSTNHISVLSRSFVNAFAKADRENKSLIFVHSHPKSSPSFSIQDNKEEKDFFRTAYIRAPNGIHGSMVFSNVNNPKLVGRIWFENGKYINVERIRVVGKRFQLFDYDSDKSTVVVPTWSDRQVRAFGREVQAWFKKLHIGVVGAGGTGSAICEQLIRLGIGKITVIDEQVLEETNVTRLYGSKISDVGKPKVDLIKRLAEEIGLGTDVQAIKGTVCDEEVAKQLRECELIFSCTDDANGRMIMNRISIWYLIPVIDMGIAIDSTEGIIRDITGRVTILLPNSACLLCRGGSSFQKQLSAEALKRYKPEEYKRLLKQKYAAELPDRDPSIIMFTSDIASRALIMFMQMLTGFMGQEWTATETIERYHETDIALRMGKNSREGREGCFCMDLSKIGLGDNTKFLGRIW